MDVFVVEDHNEALWWLYRRIGAKKLPVYNSLLVHVDSHPDLQLPPAGLTAAQARDTQLHERLSIGDWIVPALYCGHLGGVVWLRPWWARRTLLPSDGTVTCTVGTDSVTGLLRLDTPLPYFVSELMVVPAERLAVAGDARTFTLHVHTLHRHTDMAQLCDHLLAALSPSTTTTAAAAGDSFCSGSCYSSWVLDVDLDFFSTRHPFCDMLPRVQPSVYSRLVSMIGGVETAVSAAAAASGGGDAAAIGAASDAVAATGGGDAAAASGGDVAASGVGSAASGGSDATGGVGDAATTAGADASVPASQATIVATLQWRRALLLLARAFGVTAEAAVVTPPATTVTGSVGGLNKCDDCDGICGECGATATAGHVCDVGCWQVGAGDGSDGSEPLRALPSVCCCVRPVERKLCAELRQLVCDINATYSDNGDISAIYSDSGGDGGGVVDWQQVYDAACTADEGGLPDHLSSGDQIDLLMTQLQQLLSAVPRRPALVTVARSSLDNYCPPHQVDHIQRHLLECLQTVYGPLNTRLEYDSI